MTQRMGAGWGFQTLPLPEHPGGPSPLTPHFSPVPGPGGLGLACWGTVSPSLTLSSAGAQLD